MDFFNAFDLLENRLTFRMKIKHSVFLFKIIFLKKKTTQLYKFIKESFQFKIKNSMICFWKQTSKVNYVGWTFIFQPLNSVFIQGQCQWLYQTIFPSSRKVFQEKSVILFLQHIFFCFRKCGYVHPTYFPVLVLYPSDKFSLWNAIFYLAYQLSC